MAAATRDNRIIYLTARHVGSAHDSLIFNTSLLKERLEEEFDPLEPLVLLGICICNRMEMVENRVS